MIGRDGVRMPDNDSQKHLYFKMMVRKIKKKFNNIGSTMFKAQPNIWRLFNIASVVRVEGDLFRAGR